MTNASNTNEQDYLSPRRNCGGSCSLTTGSVASGTPHQYPGVRGYSGAESDAQVVEEDQVGECNLPPQANRHPGASRSCLGRSQNAAAPLIGQRGAKSSEH